MQREKTTWSVRHLTTYRYARPVELGEHRLMLRPRDGHDQRLVRSELVIEPEPVRLRWLYDALDNCVALATFAGPTMALAVESRFTVDRTEDDSPGGEIDPRARHFPFSYLPDELPDVSRSIERLYVDPGGDLERWANQFVNAGGPTQTGNLLMTMTYAIKEGFAYERREEAGVQPPWVTLDRRKGSCRDFAVLMMEALRSFGVATRFVTGYLYDDTSGATRGGGSTHAWCGVYLPGAGWVEYDPTNGLIAGANLVRVGMTRTAAQAIPVAGGYIGDAGDAEGLFVDVTVTGAPS